MDDTIHYVSEPRLSFALFGRGIAGALFGMLLIADPRASVGRIAGVFLAYLFVDCVLSLYAAKHARESGSRPGLLALVGVLDGLAAVAALAFPAVLPLRLIGGFRGVLTGTCDALWSRRHRLGDPLTLAGIAAVASGTLTLGWPGAGTVALPWLLGLQAMLTGALLVAGALSEFRHVVEAPEPV